MQSPSSVKRPRIEEPHGEELAEFVYVETPSIPVKLSFLDDPTPDVVKTLYICDPVLIETALFLLTGFKLGKSKGASLSALEKTFNKLRTTYTQRSLPLQPEKLRELAYDLTRSGLFVLNWSLGKEPHFFLSQENCDRIFDPYRKSATLQETITLYNESAAERGEDPHDVLAQAFIIHLEFLKAFSIKRTDQKDLEEAEQE